MPRTRPSHCIQATLLNYMTRVARKQTLRSLSQSYQMKDGRRGRAHPSFGMTMTFQNLSLLTSQIILSKSRCHTKRRMGAATRAHPSLGMTTTKIFKVCFLMMRVLRFHTQRMDCILKTEHLKIDAGQACIGSSWVSLQAYVKGENAPAFMHLPCCRFHGPFAPRHQSVTSHDVTSCCDVTVQARMLSFAIQIRK